MKQIMKRMFFTFAGMLVVEIILLTTMSAWQIIIFGAFIGLIFFQLGNISLYISEMETEKR